MKAVVDSNYLSDQDLLRFLGRSSSNVAVLPDYVLMEALKGDPVANTHKSFELLSMYPGQVLVLKTTYQVSGLHGGSKGLARRLVDVPRTREFDYFCRALHNAQRGEPTMRGELLRLGQLTNGHLESMANDSKEFVRLAMQAAKAFSKADQAQLLRVGPVDRNLLEKLFLATAWQSEALFGLHPAVKRIPTAAELLNTYLFRSSLCHLLLILKWAYQGGTSPNPDKITNHLVDTILAGYSTYFDELLSKDSNALFMAQKARQVLSQIPSLRR